MAATLIVFIPGIMGSCLENTHGKALWSENILDSLRELAKNPARYKLSGHASTPTLIPKGILTKLRFPIFLSFKLCARLQRRMRTLVKNRSGQLIYKDFAYDWRQDIRDTAKKFGGWVSQEIAPDMRVTIIAHSMGCLVAGLAILKGYIDPSRIDRFICIGAPFLGAPDAFDALYNGGHLPGMEQVFLRWSTKARNRAACTSALLDALQSYPSTYQLLPHLNIEFVYLKRKRVNPLATTIRVVDAGMKACVSDTHKEIRRLDKFLATGTPFDTCLIYGIGTKKSLLDYLPWISRWAAERVLHVNTKATFRASVRADAFHQPTFQNVSTKDMTDGDGTVPMLSATFGNPKGIDRRPVAGVEHSSMCQDKRVVQLIMDLLP